MKKTIIHFALAAGITAGIVLGGCAGKNAAEKMETAKEDMKAAENDSAAAVIMAANEAEWAAFKASIDNKIAGNENRLVQVQTDMKSAGKSLQAGYQKRVDSLRIQNNELKKRLNDYQRPGSDWESFKREFIHDMDGLGQALKDLVVNNK